jgi:DNA-binding MarR family transcriptional regulator
MSAARLTEKQKRAILTAYQAGEKTEAIAERFGVDRTYPSLLAKRRGLKPRNTSPWMASAVPQ